MLRDTWLLFLMKFQILKRKQKVRYSLALTTTKVHVCIKSHMIQKALLTDTYVPIAFNKLVKLTHIPSKTVGIRARKCQKTNKNLFPPSSLSPNYIIIQVFLSVGKNQMLQKIKQCSVKHLIR